MPRISRRFQDDGRCSKGSHKILPGPGAPNVTVIVEDKPAALRGDIITPHSKNEHKTSKIAQGWPTVIVNDIQVATQYMPITCGGTVVSAVKGVFAGPPS